MIRRCLFICLLILSGHSAAQDETIHLTVAVDVAQQALMTDAFFEPFEAAHPGVDVIPVALQAADALSAAPDAPQAIQNLQTFANQADILPLATNNLHPAITRTGILLDIAPLLYADPVNDRRVFHPALLQSFEWDGGLWALPTSGSIIAVMYDAQAFDAAGLPYPDSHWTTADFVHAGQVLAQRDSTGRAIVPGIMADTGALFRALLDHGFTVPKTLPAEPDLTADDLTQLLEDWQSVALDTQQARQHGFQFAPLIVGSVTLFSATGHNYTLAPLPGSTAIVEAAGYAVSSGTQHPELAYELAQFLTQHPQTTLYLAPDLPARLLADDQFQAESEEQAFVEQVISGALPASEMRFNEYIQQAVTIMLDEGQSAENALQQVQQTAEITLAFAADQHSIGTVATPIPTASPRQIMLSFGINGEAYPLPNLQAWQEVAAEFAAQDSEIDSIQLDFVYHTLEEQLQRNDCFYMENVIPAGMVDGLLDIAPLLAADSAFRSEDMVSGVMAQVRLGDGIWGFPLTMRPVVIYANKRRFGQANIPLPEPEWTVSEFEDVLRSFDSDSGLIYRSELFGGVYLRLLMAAYGGLLVDETTEPYTFYLDDPANTEAARQVLNLARAGRMQYNEIVSQYGGFFGGGDAPLYDGYFSMEVLRNGSHRLLPYPQGRRYRPAMYGLHVLYINATSTHPQACYRWFQFIRQRAELMLGMPTQRSLLEDSVLYYRGNQDVLDFYRAYDSQLQHPDTLVLTNNLFRTDVPFSVGIQNAIASRWMYLAFDDYVLRDGELEADLQQAQDFIDLFYACAAGIPERPDDLTNEQRIAYGEEFTGCAKAVEPEFVDD